MTFWCGFASGSTDPCLWLLDPDSDPEPAVFVITLKTPKNKKFFLVFLYYFLRYCSARDWGRIRITWGNPQSGCTDTVSALTLKGPPGKTPVWSESSVDEHNLYFARSAIIGYLAVETWRVKTELIIITILHIIIIITSILNLDFKNIYAKNTGAYNMHK